MTKRTQMKEYELALRFFTAEKLIDLSAHIWIINFDGWTMLLSNTLFHMCVHGSSGSDIRTNKSIHVGATCCQVFLVTFDLSDVRLCKVTSDGLSYAAVFTCEIKLFRNTFEISALYFTRNHVWNWNKIIPAAEGVLELFQNYFSDSERVEKYLWAAKASSEIILK